MSAVEAGMHFIVLPGGYGTLDEFMEIVTWAQLKIHQKPCILLNINGYYDSFLAFLDHAVVQGFIKPENRRLIQVAEDAEAALGIAQSHWKAKGTKPLHDAKLDELIER